MTTAYAGTRTRLVTIQQLTETRSPAGRPVESWTLLTTAWMERIDTRGDERFKADQLAAKYDTRWIMPYQFSMDPETLNIPKIRRLLLESRVHDIVSALPIGLHHQIELMTIAKAG